MRLKRMVKKQAFMEKLSEDINLPQDVIAGASIIKITGNKELWIENYKGLLELTEQRILLQCKQNKVSILGKKLQVKYYSDTDCLIVGFIEQIQYLF